MAKGIFQWIYNVIHNFKTPIFWKQLMAQAEIAFWAKLKQITKEMLDLLIAKILELQKQNMSGTEKFNTLVKYAEELGVNTADKDFVNGFFNMLVFTVKTRF